MNLEQRIIQRWQQWWEYKAFELSEDKMRELIAIALEEVQKEVKVCNDIKKGGDF